MSAYLCSQDHINLIVNAHPDPEKRNGQSFHLLLNENLRSLEARYPDCDFLEEWKEEAKSYRFEETQPKFIVAKAYAEAVKNGGERYLSCYPAVGKPLTQLRLEAQIRKCCDCFDYQACETGDSYYETPAALFVREVREQFIPRKDLEDEALLGLG